MNLSAIKGKAKEVGLNPGKTSKANLIRKIQEQEGNVACFRARNECDQDQCCWREDCLTN